MLDLILQLRGGDNEELRYATRSWVANLPHRQLVVAGGRPDWLTGVEYVAVEQDGRKHMNARANLDALLQVSDLTDDVIVLMDDVFVMEPIAEVPRLNRGPLADVAKDYAARHPQSPYTRMMDETVRLMAGWGFPDALSFSLHTPLVVNRQRLRDLLRRIDRELWHMHPAVKAQAQWRTLYGNCHIENSVRADDVKVYDNDRRWQWPSPFLSTSDASFRDGAVGEHIREGFPEPSPYEAR